MSNLLGVLGFVLFCAIVVGVAASVTWLVVKLSPPKSQPPTDSSST